MLAISFVETHLNVTSADDCGNSTDLEEDGDMETISYKNGITFFNSSSIELEKCRMKVLINHFLYVTFKFIVLETRKECAKSYQEIPVS